ncbi:MAG: L-idonate 5-dehydrogenase [Devosia nanyangense]|uniref:L-idonate 5-dehydrogenase n=1 Tax=Devosia nanyangense TaxID=1228055 RepID=A0A933P0K9_9HYPH|nr:L-idonate 5-dehydrogenase [Devosia nanyangense]
MTAGQQTLVCRLEAIHDLRIETQPVAEPGPGEVLVRMARGGICGSDLHYFHNGGFGAVRLRQPMILGHEISGYVEAVGPGVEGLRPGLLVAVNPSHPCGHCAACLGGEHQHCTDMRFLGSAARMPHIQGAFRERMVVGAAQCLVMPGDVTPAEAACAEPLAVCLHALAQAGSVAGKRVLVTGSGPIGVLAVAAARLDGAVEILATDVEDAALAVAARMGATRTLNVGQGSAGDASAERGRFDVAFECSGRQSALAFALDSLRPRGTLVQIGLSTEVTLPLSVLVTREIALKGTFRFNTEFDRAGQLIASRQIDVRPMITAAYPLADAVEAFRAASDRSRSCKVQLELTDHG